MWQFSAEAEGLLAASHTVASRVDVLQSGSSVYSLSVVSGSVSADANRPVRRNLTCTLVDPTGLLTTGDVGDLLNPYDSEIKPWRGVRTANDDEVAPLGVFGLTSRQVSDSPEGVVITLTGQDRSMNYQGPMSSALAISGGTPIEVAIIKLLSTRHPGLTILAMASGYTCGPLLYAPDIDVWSEAQNLAASVGGKLFHDRTGQVVFTGIGTGSDEPVASYEEGDGLLLTVDRAEDSDTIKNVVIAESTNGAIRVEVGDTDTSSPTYTGGRYGRRPTTMVSQHFASIKQATQAASAQLAYELGRSETVTFTAVPHPARDVQEVISVHRPRAGLTNRGLVVATLDMPLAADGVMRVGCRQSVLAQNGKVLRNGGTG